MWYEFLLAGLKKFAGEIIGLILIAAFWRMFPRLWKFVSQYRSQKKDDNAGVRQTLEKIQRQLEARHENVKPAAPQKSDEEARRRAKIESQLEAERREKERIQEEVRRKEEAMKQAEAQKAEEAKRRAEVQRQLEEALRKSEIKQITEVQKQRPAMSDKKFLRVCKSGNARQVEEAIMNSANVNAKDNDGNTALMMAAENGYTETADLLLMHGADVNARTNDRRTALTLAKINGRTEIVSLLRRYSVK